MNLKKAVRSVCIPLVFNIVALPANAVTYYTSEGDLLDSVSSDQSLTSENFDALGSNNVFDQQTQERLFVLSQSATESLYVSDLYATTSNNNYLGLNNVDSAFKANDSITLSFDNPIAGFGFYLITEESLEAGDFILSTGLEDIASSAIPDATLEGANAYYIGFSVDSDAEAISEIELTSSNADFDFNYNIDNISVISFAESNAQTSGGSSDTSNGGGGGVFGLIELFCFLIVLFSIKLFLRR